MKNRRKQLVVNKGFQSRMVAAVSWPIVLAIGFMALALGVVCGQMNAEAQALGIPTPSIPMTAVSVGCLVLVCVGFVLFMALRTSHRLIGPVRRMRETLDQVRGGEYGLRIHVRRGDYLNDLADGINLLLESIEEKLPELDQADRVFRSQEERVEVAPSESREEAEPSTVNS